MKNLLLLAAFVMTIPCLTAQETQSKKLFQSGIILGMQLDYLKVDNSDWEAAGINIGTSSDLESLEVENRMGFKFGILCQLNLTDNFAIVPQAILSFNDSRLNYNTGDIKHTEVIEAATIQFPLHFVFNTNQDKKVNYSVLAGGRYIRGITQSSGTHKVNLNRNDFALDLGTGLEINFKRFKVKPELIYSLGVINLIDKSNSDDFYHAAIENINRDQISFRLVFYN